MICRSLAFCLCHFLHIFDLPAFAERTARKDLDPESGQIGVNWTICAAAKRSRPDFRFALDAGTGVNSFKFDE